jgi:MoaA/NifB/PqqE/SkfB family radical SAM enzyme
MYNYHKVRNIQLEITTVCNAACPQCPRNHHGGPTIKNLPMISWTLDDVKKILPVEFVKNLENIYLCGTYGDPMANKHIVDICVWLKTLNPAVKISLHTNGSLGATKTYTALADLLDYMAFGIDGLEDTNHLYRRNTSWPTIMRNVKTFVAQGGNAIWDFIVFRHNEHQIEQAQSLSQELKFSRFNIKKTYRFFNRNHQLVPFILVDGFMLEPPSNPTYLNQQISFIDKVELESYKRTTNISCYYLSQDSIYIGADGFVFPCGWLHDRLYGVESEASVDHETIKKMMHEVGGTHMANCFMTPLEKIVDGAWFEKIADGWTTNRLDRCSMMCGTKLNLIKDQNELVNY